MTELLFAGLAIAVLNLAAAVAGYHVALNHLDRLLDIDEGESESSFPPGFDDDRAENMALSPEDIDEIDEWNDE